jgi:replicative DNA helicase
MGTPAVSEPLRNALTASGEAFSNHLTPAERAIMDTDQIFRGPGTRGDAFLLDQDNDVHALWGHGSEVLWSEGEPLFITAPPNVGKSTLAQQLAMRRAGLRDGDLLDYPVEATMGRILYIAADRPRQIARSWRRMVRDDDRLGLASTVVVYPDNLPFRISSNPEALLPFVKSFPNVTDVFIDSFMDVASLADEEPSTNANEALQSLVRHGIEVCVMHHDRKHESRRKVARLDDIYGGRAVTKGAGSVLYLEGEPGTLHAKVRHLKTPATRVQPFDMHINARSGECIVGGGAFG